MLVCLLSLYLRGRVFVVVVVYVDWPRLVYVPLSAVVFVLSAVSGLLRLCRNLMLMMQCSVECIMGNCDLW